MTKLLVLSDSHGARDAIKRILNKEQNNVDAVIFLGDGLRDLEQALAFFPHLRVYSVAGNCDYGALEPLDGLAGFDQTVVFYTHGHMYGVSFELETIKEEARARKADIVMFGHTHKPHLEYCEDGLVVLNPGSLSYPRQDGRKPSYMLMELDRNGEAHYTVCYVDQDRDIPSGLY